MRMRNSRASRVKLPLIARILKFQHWPRHGNSHNGSAGRYRADDGKHYPLPPGLGAFPLRHIEDFADRVPEAWRERAGVMMPLYQAEAIWISFSANWWSGGSYPCAIKVAAGKINAISGKLWKPKLDRSDRDYIVVPEQPWLDGFCVAKHGLCCMGAGRMSRYPAR